VTFQHFGTPEQFAKTGCSYFETIQPTGFVAYNHGKPVCGSLVATNAASS
jgi:hypothetical protein